ncbi:hypothetical protein EG327_009946 [Venturia inaequalis]|uniref:Uncharacterized protein n=1 Tax=Venturia inaequalis TaxID=5025 RepID=A0A8H3YW41_VENIN|nr:hypothetical protein EG327_009946 [Venturia inaequalis]
MKSTIIAVLFLAAGAVADYTVCSQDADKDRYHGRCVIHTDDGKATSKWNPCLSTRLQLDDKSEDMGEDLPATNGAKTERESRAASAEIRTQRMLIGKK